MIGYLDLIKRFGWRQRPCSAWILSYLSGCELENPSLWSPEYGWASHQAGREEKGLFSFSIASLSCSEICNCFNASSPAWAKPFMISRNCFIRPSVHHYWSNLNFKGTIFEFTIILVKSLWLATKVPCPKRPLVLEETSKKYDSFRLWQKGQESTWDTRTLTQKWSLAPA